MLRSSERTDRCSGLVLTHIRATCCYSNHEFSKEKCYIKNEIERNVLVVDMNAFSVHSFHLEHSLYSVRLCYVYFRNCMLLIHFESLRSARSPERHISAFINIVWKKITNNPLGVHKSTSFSLFDNNIQQQQTAAQEKQAIKNIFACNCMKMAKFIISDKASQCLRYGNNDE